MRTILLLASLAVAGLLAPAAPRAADLKIGFVDMQRALSETDDGKAATAQFEREGKEKKKKVDEKEAELRRLNEELKKQSVILSDAAKKAKEAEFEAKYGEYQVLRAQLQQEMLVRERELTEPIARRLQALVKELADADGFMFVFERNQAGIIVGPESFDLTNELIRKYNARNAKKK